MTVDERFAAAKSAVLNGLGASDGIGTLSERSLHAILKAFYEPNKAYHEVPVDGYVADICHGKKIVEIQTHDLGRLRDKLKAFTASHTVTVVYPIAERKRIVLTDPETGEIVKESRSPKRGNVSDAYLELLRLKEYLTHEKVRVELVFLDLTEYRKVVPKSRKNHRGAECTDRLPESITKILPLGGKDGFTALLPDGLPSPFTAKDFAAAVKRHGRTPGIGLKLLSDLHLIEKVGKRASAFLYEIHQGR